MTPIRRSTPFRRDPSVSRPGLLLAATLMMALPAVAENNTFHHLEDGIVVDGAGTTYLMTPSGGIDAVRVETGRSAWISQKAAKPLAIADGHLIAQVELRGPHLGVASLALDSGDTAFTAQVQLPSDTRARIDDSLGRRFEATATVANDRCTVYWTATQRVVQGARAGAVGSPGAKQADGGSAQRPQAKVTSGAARIDLRSGQTEAWTTKAKTAPVGFVTYTELGPGEGIRGVVGRQFTAIDGQHVLVSERREDETYTWTLFTRGGERIGSVNQRQSMRPFLVRGGTLLIVTPSFIRRSGDELVDQPRTLRAIDLLTGFETWTRAVRDTRYRGSMPS